MQQRLTSIGLIVLGVLVGTLAFWGLVNEVGGKWLTFLWALLVAVGPVLLLAGTPAFEAIETLSRKLRDNGDRTGDGEPKRVARASPGMSWNVAVWALLLVYPCVVVCAYVYPPVRIEDLIAVSLVAYGVGLLVFALIAGALLSGGPHSFDRWLGATIGAVLLSFPGSVGAVSAVNALADGSPPVAHRIPVIDMQTRRTHSWLLVQGWNGGPPVAFRATNDEYLQTVPGRSEMHLVTGRGALGIEWLRSKQIRF